MNSNQGLFRQIMICVNEACVRFPWQDCNGKRQIKFGAKMENVSHSGVTWELYCLLIGLYLYVYRSAIAVVASMSVQCTYLKEYLRKMKRGLCHLRHQRPTGDEQTG